MSQAREPRLIGVEALGVAGGEFRDLGFRAAGCDLEIAPVGQRQEVRQGTLDDAEPVAVKLEIADDLGFEKRDGVGGDRIAETRWNSSVAAAPPTCARRSSTVTLRPVMAR